MTALIPYLSAIVTLLFGAAFYFGLQDTKEELDEE